MKWLSSAVTASMAGCVLASEDRPITKVVKLLEDMLKKSGEDAQNERKLFAKFKCYCDTNTDEKTEAIKKAKADIADFDAKIAELTGSSGILSQELAKLKADMESNEAARDKAQTIRDKANADFLKEEADMEAALASMQQAISTLAAIGADQTDNDTRDTADTDFQRQKDNMMKREPSFMEKRSLRRVDTEVKTALHAAAGLLSVAQKKTIAAFLQGPSFTGTYTSQSGEIIGILKNMRDTFTENLANARDSEAKAVEAHDKFMTIKKDEWDTMDALKTEKNDQLGANDEELGNTRESRKTTATQLDEDEKFLEELTDICTKKTAQYEDRKSIRTQEDAAIAQAVSILNSDEAFETFGKATATSGRFVQIRARKNSVNVQQTVLKNLLSAARKTKSLKLTKIAMLLQTKTNAFTKVLALIQDMIKLIEEEEKADDDKKAWCDDERQKTRDTIQEKKDAIGVLEGEIADLQAEIEKLTGEIADANTALVECKNNQQTSTETRNEEHVAYNTDIGHLKGARSLLDKALTVLTKFYDMLHAKQGKHHYEEMSGSNSKGGLIERIPGASIEELKKACSDNFECAGFDSQGNLKNNIGETYTADSTLYKKVFEGENPVLLQQPAPPSTWDDEYAGQRSDASGKSESGAIGMLKKILTDTKSEEEQAHKDEADSQHAYQDEMTSLTEEQATLEETISQKEGEKAAASESKLNKEEEKARTVKEKEMNEKYLADIKPGCDFIDENIDQRKANRVAETDALNSATDLLKGTPAFKAAVAHAEQLALGTCKDVCNDMGKEHVECKACLAEVSVPGYCAGHAGTQGCP